VTRCKVPVELNNERQRALADFNRRWPDDKKLHPPSINARTIVPPPPVQPRPRGNKWPGKWQPNDYLAAWDGTGVVVNDTIYFTGYNRATRRERTTKHGYKYTTNKRGSIYRGKRVGVNRNYRYEVIEVGH
jgi:hypothetical protein